MLFCIRPPNFIQIGAPNVDIWRHIHFSRWRLRPLNTTSGFVFVEVTAFRSSIWFAYNNNNNRISIPPSVVTSEAVNRHQQTKFRRHILIDGWDITTSGFEIQTSAILEFYFRFLSRPFLRNWRIILHPAAEFRPNRNMHRRIMTSYRFSRWRLSAMLYLLWGNGGPPTKCLSWSEFRPRIASSLD